MRDKISLLLISENVFTVDRVRSIERSDEYSVLLENSPDHAFTLIKMHDPKVIIFDLTTGNVPLTTIKSLQTEKFMRGRGVFVVIDQLQDPPEHGLGFSDVLYTGFSENELKFRIELCLYRSHLLPAKKVLAFGDLVIDEDRFQAYLNHRPLDLAFMEYQLLLFLAKHRDRVFTREDLLSHVWGQELYVGTRTVDVHIRRLRSKLGQEYENYIRTVRNVGYKFIS